jgi:hypothetical protein
VGGYTHWHAELERALARLKGTQDCLLFPTGFAANLAVAAALCQDGNVTVLSDELNHASIVDGVALARRRGARLLVYRHNDLAHLEQLLKEDVPPGDLQQLMCGPVSLCLASPCLFLLPCVCRLCWVAIMYNGAMVSPAPSTASCCSGSLFWQLASAHHSPVPRLAC